MRPSLLRRPGLGVDAQVHRGRAADARHLVHDHRAPRRRDPARGRGQPPHERRAHGQRAVPGRPAPLASRGRRSIASTPCARLRPSSEMFDLRYHVASLAAVFLALIIGILVGVGISDRGLVDSAKTKFLQDEVASLQHRLDNKSTQKADQARDRVAAQTFINETYPALAAQPPEGQAGRGRVRRLGSTGGIRSSVDGALTDAGRAAGAAAGAEGADRRASSSTQRSRASPPRPGCAGRPTSKPSAARSARSSCSAATRRSGTRSPTRSSSEQDGGNKMPADGVVVVRTARPQTRRDERSSCSASTRGSARPARPGGRRRADRRGRLGDRSLPRRRGLSTVDDVDTPGRAARARAPARRPAAPASTA